jgi:hypothetical protein
LSERSKIVNASVPISRSAKGISARLELGDDLRVDHAIIEAKMEVVESHLISIDLVHPAALGGKQELMGMAARLIRK